MSRSEHTEKKRTTTIMTANDTTEPNRSDETIINRYGTPLTLMDGFDDAFMGVGMSFSQDKMAVYDYDKVIEILVNEDEMTYDEAVEYFDFNIIGAYIGKETPVFIKRDTYEQKKK